MKNDWYECKTPQYEFGVIDFILPNYANYSTLLINHLSSETLGAGLSHMHSVVGTAVAPHNWTGRFFLREALPSSHQAA